ncbi:MAG: endonuclease domain-containing protein [Clostridia bacterium]|nr:endonuclease domain-containing protein [Clostridia bacterium]
MPIPYERKLIPYAQKLRKESTPQENKLWYRFLKDYPIRFQRQKTIDSFIADFYCYRAKLIIEIDGSQHHIAQGTAYDRDRTAILNRYGLDIIRFTNQEIDQSFLTVCSTIDQIVTQRLCSINRLTAPDSPD